MSAVHKAIVPKPLGFGGNCDDEIDEERAQELPEEQGVAEQPLNVGGDKAPAAEAVGFAEKEDVST